MPDPSSDGALAGSGTATARQPIDLVLREARTSRLPLDQVEIAPILAAFLERDSSGSASDLRRVGQFLDASSQVILLKSQCLLPAIAPAQQLVDARMDTTPAHRLECAGYRTIAGRFRMQLENGRESFPRRAPVPVGTMDRPLRAMPAAVLSTLMSEQLARLRESHPRLVVAPIVLPVEAATRLLRGVLTRSRRLSFTRWLRARRMERHQVVVHFLALLEMLRAGGVVAVQAASFDEISIEVTEQRKGQAG